MATYYIYFLFLTYELKCSTTDHNIVDQQNGHSMAIAVEGIVELFKLEKKKRELHGKLLIFLISYNHQTVRLYGYYLILDRRKINIYCYLIYIFNIAALNEKKK